MFLGPFLGTRADFIISNPPYLDAHPRKRSKQTCFSMSLGRRFFRRAAIHCTFIEQIASGAAALLSPGGQIFLEVAARTG